MSRRTCAVLILTLAALGVSLSAGQLVTSLTGGVTSPQTPVVTPMPSPPRDVPPPAMTRRVPIGTGAITGTVTAAATGRPIAGARVMLSGSSGGPADFASARGLGPATGRGAMTFMPLQRDAVTDAQGKFAFEALPAGQFTVNASANRYLAQSVGQRGRTQPPPTLRLSDGQRQAIEIKLQRGGVIEGTVYGIEGDPSAGAQVRAYLFSYASGTRRLQQNRAATTDDRGVYRLFDLQPGEYVVSATSGMGDLMMVERAAASAAAFSAALAATSPSPGRAPTVPFVVIETPSQVVTGPTSGFAPTFAPSASSASDAVRVTIEPGTERTGIDIHSLAVRAGTVSGTVAGVPDGTRVMISILFDGPSLEAGNTMTTSAAADGSFNLVNISPGKYVVLAQTTPMPQAFTVGAAPRQPQALEPKDRLWARAEVQVDGPGTPRLAMALRPGRTISGTVIAPASRARMLAQMAVMLTRSTATAMIPSTGPMPQAEVGADGRFTLEGVAPGSYVLRVNGAMKSSVVDGKDTLDEPLEFDGDKDVTGAVITMVDRMAVLTGALTDTSGAGTSAYSIVLASTDKRHWTPGSRRVQLSRASADGRFGFSNLPAGSYLLAAVTDIESGAHYDPAFLEALSSSALRVTITEGGMHTQDIRLAQ